MPTDVCLIQGTVWVGTLSLVKLWKAIQSLAYDANGKLNKEGFPHSICELGLQSLAVILNNFGWTGKFD